MKLNIGIDETHRKAIVEGLSHFLADSYTLYLKTQSYHWNVTGPHFTLLHQLFEEQYVDLAGAVDEIAERIRSLGFPAPGSYAQFSKLAEIKEDTTVPKAHDMVKQLIADHETLIRRIRTILPSATDSHDEGTADLLIKRLETHEKKAWMMRSLLED